MATYQPSNIRSTAAFLLKRVMARGTQLHHSARGIQNETRSGGYPPWSVEFGCQLLCQLLCRYLIVVAEFWTALPSQTAHRRHQHLIRPKMASLYSTETVVSGVAGDQEWWHSQRKHKPKSKPWQRVPPRHYRWATMLARLAEETGARE